MWLLLIYVFIYYRKSLAVNLLSDLMCNVTDVHCTSVNGSVFQLSTRIFQTHYLRICVLYWLWCSFIADVSIVTRLQAGRPRFDSRQGLSENFFHATASGPALGPTQPPIQWVPGALSLEVKPAREADHSPPSSVEVRRSRMRSLYLHSPNTPSWRGVQ
jgi:hypothetical protein